MLGQQDRHAQRFGHTSEQLAQRVDTACRSTDAQAGERSGGLARRHDDRRRLRRLCQIGAEQARQPIDERLGKLFAETTAAGLRENVARSQRQCLDRRSAAFLAISGKDDHLAARIRAEKGGKRRQSALPRQLDVQQDQVDLMRGQITQCMFGTVGLVDHRKCRIAIQDARDHCPHDDRIIDNHYADLRSALAGQDRRDGGH